MEWGLALAAVLAVVAVVFVARPFLREPAPASDRLDELAPEARQWLALAEERDRALEALKELEFDHRTGKVSDEDYRAQIGPLRRGAADALRALEAREQSQREHVQASERQSAEAKKRIRLVRLPVPETLMVAPTEPNAPYPPPDEGDPPTPAIVPEPSPPPDEGTPPAPAPDPDND